MIVQIIIVFMLIRIIRIILAIDYSNIFLENKNKKALLVTIVFVYLSAVATDVIFDSLYIRIIEEFIIIYLIVYTYEGDIIRKLILSVMNVALCGVSDIVTSYIMSGTILIQNGSASSEFVSVLLLYLCILIIKNMYKVKTHGRFGRHWIYLLVLALISISVWYIIAGDIIMTHDGIMFVGGALLVMNIMSYKLFEYVTNSYEYEQENMKLKEQMDIYECQISNSIANDREVRELRHDMKRHLKEIQILAAQGEYGQLNQYIQDMTDDASVLDNMIGTGNVALDGILNYMCSKALKNNIQVTRKITVPEDAELVAYDMNIILGNLLDNAIENALKTDEPKIDIVIKYRMGMLRINIVNSCIHDQNIIDGRYISTKLDEIKNHGYGMINIRKCVAKYNGTVKFSNDDKRFKAEVLLYI